MARALLLLPVLLGSLATFAAPVRAQTATLRVFVIDDMTGDPVEGALIRLRGREPDTSTGANGRVEITGLEPKEWKLEVRAVGFEPRFETIYLQAGQVADFRYGLSFTGEQLPEIVVEARAAKLAPRYADFHRRMDRGLGYFLTWKTIKERGFTSVGEALRTVRGVRVTCRTHDCLISMSRSESCPVAYWIDGYQQTMFTSTTPIRDIYGVEVYRGSGEMPGEFAGTSGCGAIVIWTKNKPYR